MRTPEQRRSHLRRRAEYWSGQLQTLPRMVRIQHMPRKWGSCSSSGVVTLAVDLADEQQSFQDYVIVHELLHLRIPNHGKVFKALMTAHVPGWRQYDQQRRASITHSVAR